MTTQSPYKLSTSFLSTSPTTNSKLTIATHSGTFQADEALAVWLLRHTHTYFNASVIRTRDPSIYTQADIVVDVGGVYNHLHHNYDHHQRGYLEYFNNDSNRCTKLSASGLIYRHYGHEVIANLYPTLAQDSSPFQFVYTTLYDNFMECIDAVDTGVELVPDTVKVNYKDLTGLASRVSRLNPQWNQHSNDLTDENDRFERASTLCGMEFMEALRHLVEHLMPARKLVEDAVKKRHDIDYSGEIICFSSGGMPWKGHLYDIERELGLVEEHQLIKFVLYEDQKGNMWRIQAVTVEGRKFDNRLSLPEPWRGVRDEDLETISEIQGCKFCHVTGFIGGAMDYEGVLKMAKVALKYDT